MCRWLQDKYGGFNSSQLVDDFVYYADTVFSHLGRFVQRWITFNEPLVTCDLGFKAGERPMVAPGLLVNCPRVDTVWLGSAICLSFSTTSPSNQHQQGSMGL